MEITATQPVRGVNIPIRSIVARKPAPAAARQTMTMPITVIPTGTGQNTTKRSIAEQGPVRPAAIRTMSMATIGIPMRMVSAMIVARMSR